MLTACRADAHAPHPCETPAAWAGPCRGLLAALPGLAATARSRARWRRRLARDCPAFVAVLSAYLASASRKADAQICEACQLGRLALHLNARARDAARKCMRRLLG